MSIPAYKHLLLAVDFAPETDAVVTRAGQLRGQG
jgi:hypothetical protein